VECGNAVRLCTKSTRPDLGGHGGDLIFCSKARTGRVKAWDRHRVWLQGAPVELQ
jgi:hypothetical protein